MLGFGAGVSSQTGRVRSLGGTIPWSMGPVCVRKIFGLESLFIGKLRAPKAGVAALHTAAVARRCDNRYRFGRWPRRPRFVSSFACAREVSAQAQWAGGRWQAG